MRYFFCLLAFILVLGNIAVGQQEKPSQTIRGKVIDKDTQQPLAGANVVITNMDKQKGTTTDKEGIFHFEDIPTGRRDLYISYLGYEEKTLRNLTLKSGKELVLTIELEESVEEMEEVVVTAFQKGEPKNEMAKVSARAFTVEETEKYAGSWGDPSRMAQNYAGVMSAGDQRNDIIIRGNPPIGLLWRLEGMNIPNPNHFGALGATGGPVSILNNNLLNNSDFFTGAFPAEYGNALSGVFDLEMRNGNNETKEYTGQIGFNGFELGAEGPFMEDSKASYLINYRYSTLALMEKLNINTGVGAVPQYQDVSFKVNIPAEQGNISLFGIGGTSFIELDNKERDETDFSYNTSEGTETINGSDMGTTGISTLYFLSESSRIESGLNYSINRVTTTIDSIATEERDKKLYYHENNTQQKIGLYNKYTNKVNQANIIEAGLNVENFMTEYIDSVYTPQYNTYVKQLDVKKNFLMLYQIYGQWEHRLNQNFTLYGGINFEYFGYNDSWSLEPRFNFEWELSENHSISGGYGYHSQLQPLFLYFVQTRTGKEQYLKTNKNLDFTNSNQWIAGYTHAFESDIQLKIEGYYQHQHNIPVTEYDSYFSLANYGANFHLNRVDSLVNEGASRNYGVDVTLEKFFSNNYYFLLTTSIFDSKYRGSNGKLKNTAFNKNYVVNALAGYEYELSDKGTIALNLRMVASGGKRYTPIDLEKSREENEVHYKKDLTYAKQFKDYFRLDGRLSYKKDDKNITQEWALDITNLTDHQNIFNRTYSRITKNIKTEYQQGFYPMMFYRIHF